MARRKKRVHHHKRRRIGALSGDMGNSLTLLAGVIGGAIAGRFLDNFLAKQSTVSINDKTLQMVKIGGGAYLAVKMKQPFVRGVGLGLAAGSAVSELTDMGMLKGIGRVDPRKMVFTRRGLNGPGMSQTNFPSVGEVVRPGAVGRLGAAYAGVYN